MFVGIGRFELFMPLSSSLKDKRRILRSVSQTVRNKLNVSIAEVDHQGLWQRAAFGVTCVAESMGHCEKVLAEVERIIGKTAVDGAEIIDRSVEFVSLDDL
jgi:uncharacterized protein